MGRATSSGASGWAVTSGGVANLPPLDEVLPMTLLRAREAVIGLFRPAFADRDLTEQQWRILRALADGPRNVGGLAAATSLLGPSIARILPGLEARGLLTRRPSPGDGRSIECTITPAGRALVDEIAPALTTAYERIDAHLGGDDLETLRRLLLRLAEIPAEQPLPGVSTA